MTDTPRTDGVAYNARDEGYEPDHVDADFARTLERELTDARRALSDSVRLLDMALPLFDRFDPLLAARARKIVGPSATPQMNSASTKETT